MRQVAQGKYNVAWFKLAEFVARGEKERALGLYKLLSHSFDDYALGCQLAGDILLAFNDREGIEKYKQAAELYRNSDRVLEAIGLYEQLNNLVPEDSSFNCVLVDLYMALGLRRQAQETGIKVIPLLVSRDQHQEALDIIQRYAIYFTQEAREELLVRIKKVHDITCKFCLDIQAALDQ